MCHRWHQPPLSPPYLTGLFCALHSSFFLHMADTLQLIHNGESSTIFKWKRAFPYLKSMVMLLLALPWHSDRRTHSDLSWVKMQTHNMQRFHMHEVTRDAYEEVLHYCKILYSCCNPSV